MDTRQKLLIGIIGIKEAMAKMDAEISVKMHTGRSPINDEDLQFDLEDRVATEVLLEKMESLSCNPTISLSIEVLTKTK